MPIPFPPGGPQVQAAIQNPARFPDQQLQQYAQGQQPTGQVPPPLAANELTVRNAQRQAAARQTAMQNNPKQSPTVFQQKDMELQQKAQQLAAMQQQMQQQTQQKEQQLGVMGALLAKKAQDLQARESMGIANLPIRPDMFTAMDGGIVFSHGGNVERYAKGDLVGRYTPVPKRAGILETAGLDTNEETPEKEDQLDLSIGNIRNKLVQFETALRGANLSPEKKAELLKAAEEKLTGQYSKYKQGLASLDTETKAALEGEAPTFQQRIARGLANVPADIRGVRLGQGLAMLAGGAGQADADYEKRKREAAQYMADARRKGLAADFAEERGRPELARKLIAGEEADLAKTADIESKIAKTGLEAEKGIAGLHSREDLLRERLKSKEQLAEAERKYKEKRDEDKNALLLSRIQLEAAKIGAGNRTLTDLQARQLASYNVLKEQNDSLPPQQRKSDAQLRDAAFGLAETALLGSRRTSAAASMLRAEVFNSKTLSEAMNRLRYDPAYIEASATEKRELEDAVRARFPASRDMPPGAIPYPQRSNAPPPPPGFVPNSR